MQAVEQAEEIIHSAYAEFGPKLAVLTSFQREGVVIIDMVRKMNFDVHVLTLDTLRLPEATHQMIDTVEQHFGIHVERIFPATEEVEALDNLHGPMVFRESLAGRRLCCEIRKVRPLAAHSANWDGFFVGLRRMQSDQRKDLPIIDTSQTPAKISPLVEWSAEDVQRYTRDARLPEHPLYAAGYASIGCDPCTRAISAGEEERAGRWWWEQDGDKECGLHFSPEGRVTRTLDVLLEQLLEKAHEA